MFVVRRLILTAAVQIVRIFLGPFKKKSTISTKFRVQIHKRQKEKLNYVFTILNYEKVKKRSLISFFY
jgi:hypothetical protein